MKQQEFTIGVNREYNFHPAFHGEIFSILERQFVIREFPIINFSEVLIRKPRGSFFSRQVFSCGRFIGEADILFSPHVLLTNRSKWIMELEHPFWLFTDHYANVNPNYFSFKLRKWLAKKWLALSNCKAIIAWSNVSRRILTDLLEEGLAEKARVIYPMVQPPEKTVVKRSKNEVVLLFIMPNKPFETKRKGKDVALSILRTMGRYKTVRMIFVGYLTDQEKNEFGNLIEHYSWVERKKMLSEIYPRSDILLFPSRADTFGAVIMEAQSRGVVPIATWGKSVFSTPEIIRNARNGFLIKNKKSQGNELDYEAVNIQEFTKAVILLINNQELRNRMSKQCSEEFLKSMFNPINQKSKVLDLFSGFLNIKNIKIKKE